MLKSSFYLRQTHSFAITKFNWLMQFRETIAVRLILRIICNQICIVWSECEHVNPNASDTHTSKLTTSVHQRIKQSVRNAQYDVRLRVVRVTHLSPLLCI